MKRHATSPLSLKSLELARQICEYAEWLIGNRREYTIADQLKRCGISVGANIVEANEAQSAPDMLHKLSISLKEARECEYYLATMKSTELEHQPLFESIAFMLDEVIALLITSKKTLRKKIRES